MKNHFAVFRKRLFIFITLNRGFPEPNCRLKDNNLYICDILVSKKELYLESRRMDKTICRLNNLEIFPLNDINLNKKMKERNESAIKLNEEWLKLIENWMEVNEKFIEINDRVFKVKDLFSVIDTNDFLIKECENIIEMNFKIFNSHQKLAQKNKFLKFFDKFVSDKNQELKETLRKAIEDFDLAKEKNKKLFELDILVKEKYIFFKDTNRKLIDLTHQNRKGSFKSSKQLVV